MNNINKGDLIRISGNSILNDAMGLGKYVFGRVLLIYPDNHDFSFQCTETGAIETCDFDDGLVEKLVK